MSFEKTLVYLKAFASALRYNKEALERGLSVNPFIKFYRPEGLKAYSRGLHPDPYTHLF